MHLEINSFLATDKSTISTLHIDGKFACYTLEDPFHEPKIYGETRIPAGVYKLRLRTFGGFHQRYTKKFFAEHRGMLEICDVPNFEHVLIHIGNDASDTEGCILVGQKAGKDAIYDSTIAYRRIYPMIAEALFYDEEVTLAIR